MPMQQVSVYSEEIRQHGNQHKDSDFRRRVQFTLDYDMVIEYSSLELAGTEEYPHYRDTLQRLFTERGFKERAKELGIRINCGTDTGYIQRGKGTGRVSVSFDAPSSKEIISEEDALKRLEETGLRADIESLLRDAAETVNTDYERLVQRTFLLRNALSLASAFSSEATKRAKDIVRLQQRLDALVAEYVAEVKVQADKLITSGEMEKQVASHNEKNPDDRFSPDEVELAKKFAKTYAEEDAAGILSIGRFGERRKPMDVTDVQAFLNTKASEVL